MSLWIWLSHRFGPEAFPGLEAVAAKSEAIIELMNQGLTRMCEANKEKVRKRPKAGRRGRGQNTQGPQLLLKHDPLALAYLADAKNHKYINSYEWVSPGDAKAAVEPQDQQRAPRRLQAAL